MQVKELDDLVVWIKGNVLNVFELSPEDFISEAEELDYQEPDGPLQDRAVLYQWCARRKRLVRSN